MPLRGSGTLPEFSTLKDFLFNYYKQEYLYRTFLLSTLHLIIDSRVIDMIEPCYWHDWHPCYWHDPGTKLYIVHCFTKYSNMVKPVYSRLLAKRYMRPCTPDNMMNMLQIHTLTCTGYFTLNYQIAWQLSCVIWKSIQSSLLLYNIAYNYKQ